MCSSSFSQTSQAFNFLKEVMQVVNKTVPNLKRQCEYLPTLQNLVGVQIKNLIENSSKGDTSSHTAASISSFPTTDQYHGPSNNTALEKAQEKINKTKEKMQQNV